MQRRLLLTPAVDRAEDGDLVAIAHARPAWTVRGARGLPDGIAGAMSTTQMPGNQPQVVLNDLVSGAAAHQSLAPGIKVCTLQAGNRPGKPRQIDLSVELSAGRDDGSERFAAGVRQIDELDAADHRGPGLEQRGAGLVTRLAGLRRRPGRRPGR